MSEPISMRTEEDKKIQGKLESAGKGLPFIEAFMLRYVVFPILKTFMSWNMGMRFFEYEGKRILNAVKKLDDSTIFKKVLIPRIHGIEDNSRYYSPAMVLWHLIYVGKTIQDGIISLSKNERHDFLVQIENFKPFVKISHDIVNEYEAFLWEYRDLFRTRVRSYDDFNPCPDVYLTCSETHPLSF